MDAAVTRVAVVASPDWPAQAAAIERGLADASLAVVSAQRIVARTSSAARDGASRLYPRRETLRIACRHATRDTEQHDGKSLHGGPDRRDPFLRRARRTDDHRPVECHPVFESGLEPEIVQTDHREPRAFLCGARDDLQPERHRRISRTPHDATAHETPTVKECAQMLGDGNRLGLALRGGAHETSLECVGQAVMHAHSVANICSLVAG